MAKKTVTKITFSGDFEFEMSGDHTNLTIEDVFNRFTGHRNCKGGVTIKQKVLKSPSIVLAKTTYNVKHDERIRNRVGKAIDALKAPHPIYSFVIDYGTKVGEKHKTLLGIHSASCVYLNPSVVTWGICTRFAKEAITYDYSKGYSVSAKINWELLNFNTKVAKYFTKLQYSDCYELNILECETDTTTLLTTVKMTQQAIDLMIELGYTTPIVTTFQLTKYDNKAFIPEVTAMMKECFNVFDGIEMGEWRIK
jgi:hypothetical protein